MLLLKILFNLRTSLLVFAGLILSLEISFAQEIPYLQWAYRTGNRFDDYGKEIKVDAAGNIYTIGVFQSSVDFDPGTANFILTESGSGYDAFITKFTPSGSFVWARKFGGVSSDVANDFTFDGSGNILITGAFDETVDFDPDPIDVFNLSAPSGGMFVVKLDTNGDFIWAIAVEGANGQGITTDNAGNIYTTGSFSVTADFNPGSSSFTLTAVGGADIFIQKLDANGNFSSAIAIGGTSSDSGTKINFSPLNELYVTGSFSTTVDFDPGTTVNNLTSSGSLDIFLSKWDTNLNLMWANRFGATGSDSPRSATVDASGNVYLTGQFQNTVDFNPGTGTTNLVSAGNWDIFFAKYNPSGGILTAMRFGSTSIDTGAGVTLDGSGNIYLTGSFVGTADFNPGAATFNLVSNGFQDIYVLKLNASGNFLWAVNSGTTNADNGLSISVDALGNIYSTGLFRNTVDFDFGSGTLNLTSPSNISSSNDADIFIQKISTVPSVFVYTNPTSITVCAGATVIFDAKGTGTSNITYQWEKFDGVSTFVNLSNGPNANGVTTAQLTLTNVIAGTSGDYRCKISGDFDTPEFTNTATLTLTPTPSKPTTLGATVCAGGQATLKAFGASDGDYLWYTSPTGGSPIGVIETESAWTLGTYTTPFLSTTTTYYVVITSGSCESLREPVTATVTPYVATTTEIAALTAFYNSTNGDDWNDNTNWLVDSDVSTWYGVSVSGCKISGIELSTNNLDGPIPPEIGDLINLESLTLAENNLTGNLPIEIGNLTNLKNLWLDGNWSGSIPTEIGLLTNLETLRLAGYNPLGGFTGNIPTEIGNLSSLYYLDLSGNFLSGAVPASITNLSSLNSLFLRNNLLSDLPDLTSLNIEVAAVENNALSFEDLEPNISIPTFSYDPQAKVPPGGIVSFDAGSSLSIPFSMGGASNTYQWFKDGLPIAGAITSAFSVASSVSSDVGTYYVEIQNLIVPGLILQSKDYLTILSTCTSGSTISGNLDPTFNAQFANSSTVSAIELQSTGKIIATTFNTTAAGNAVDGVVRFNTDGSLDNTFTSSTNYGSAELMTIQDDDKILLQSTGTYSQIFRLNADGTPDAVFNSNSPQYYSSNFIALALQPDNKIIAVVDVFGGTTELVRINADGTNETSLSTTDFDSYTSFGFLTNLIKVQTDGRILIAANSMLYGGGLYRLDQTGISDASFSSVSFDNAITDLVVQPDGKIIVIGSFTSINGITAYGIARLNEDGSLDPTFKAAGFEGPPLNLTKIELLNDGRIVVSGYFTKVNGAPRKNLVVLNSDGSIDCSFDAGISADNSILDLAVQDDGQILIAGDFNNYDGTMRPALARIKNGGLAISITSQPSDFIACVGQAATFTTAATGTTNITYQWQFSLTGNTGTFNDIANGSGYSNVTTSILSINTTGNFGVGRYRCRINGDFATEVITNDEGLFINPVPVSPITIGNSSCLPGNFVLAASGGTNGQYRWYDIATGGTSFSGEVNSTYTTPVLSTTTNYYVAISNGSCESPRSLVVAQITSTLATPVATSAANCGAASLTLNASGGTNGQYHWYDVAAGGTSIAGEVNSSFTTTLLSSTTTYYVSINNGICESTRTAVVAQIDVIPAAPLTTNNSSCGPAALIVNASGATDGQYRWYTVATGGTAIVGEVNSAFTTPSLSASTTYFASINNGTCESTRTSVIAQINAVPATPAVTSGSGCLSSPVTLSASGAINGHYRWYTTATGGTSIAGETNSTYVTPPLNANTTYYVSINDGTCESARATVTANITSCTTNLPPAIKPTSLTTEINGLITLSLLSVISDPDNNIDLTKLTIVSQPISGAIASIDTNQNLIIDYSNVAFSGTDELTIEVCDFAGSCVQQKITIKVDGDIIVYNGISPNGDQQNAIFEIKNIDLLESTKNNRVSIFNRWGSKVYEAENYNNKTRVFTGLNDNGNDLPSGTYFYKIEFSSGREQETGYLTLKR